MRAVLKSITVYMSFVVIALVVCSFGCIEHSETLVRIVMLLIGVAFGGYVTSK